MDPIVTIAAPRTAQFSSRPSPKMASVAILITSNVSAKYIMLSSIIIMVASADIPIAFNSCLIFSPPHSFKLLLSRYGTHDISKMRIIRYPNELSAGVSTFQITIKYFLKMSFSFDDHAENMCEKLYSLELLMRRHFLVPGVG